VTASPGEPGAIPPLVVEFEVACDPEHAFETWVGRTASWWPRGHTRSGDALAIVFEPHPGGRIFERTSDGRELEWGEVLDWEAPRRLRLLWHHVFDRSEATQVEVAFTEADGGTKVRIVQTGWEALGDEGRARRDRTSAGWSNVTAPYRALAEEGSS
jgi:uncharacterized protein YndB with AHSA1/START domain